MARILWATLAQSNGVGASPKAEFVPISTADTGSTVTFTVTPEQAATFKVNDNLRVSGGTFAPSTSSALPVVAVTSSTVVVTYVAAVTGEPASIASQSGRIGSEFGLPNSGSFWSRVAENYTKSTGDLVQVVEYGEGGTSFIADWAGLEIGLTGNDAVVQNEGDGNFDPNNLLSLALADINLRMQDSNGITPYDELWISFQHGQADTEGLSNPGEAPYASTGGTGSTTDGIQAGFYSEALQSMHSFLVGNLNSAPSAFYIGSTIPSASYGNNNAMDNVIEAGIDNALITLTDVIRGPMMHTEFAIKYGVITYPHNEIAEDDHTTIEGQEYMAVVYSLFLTDAPVLTTPYIDLSNDVGDTINQDLAPNWLAPERLKFDIFQAPDDTDEITGLPGACSVQGEATARASYQTQVLATDVFTGLSTLAPAFTWDIERLAALGSVANQLAALDGPAIGFVPITAFDEPVTALASGTDLIPRYLYARVTGDVVLIGLDGVEFTHDVTVVGIQKVGFVQIVEAGTTGTIDDYDGLT